MGGGLLSGTEAVHLDHLQSRIPSTSEDNRKARRKERLLCVSEVVSGQFLAYQLAGLSLAQKPVTHTVLPGPLLSSTAPKETERICLQLKGLGFGDTGCHEEAAAVALRGAGHSSLVALSSEEAGPCGH